MNILKSYCKFVFWSFGTYSCLPSFKVPVSLLNYKMKQVITMSFQMWIIFEASWYMAMSQFFCNIKNHKGSIQKSKKTRLSLGSSMKMEISSKSKNFEELCYHNIPSFSASWFLVLMSNIFIYSSIHLTDLNLTSVTLR